MALIGLGLVVALAAAYLSDCIPGLGSGGSLGTPSSESPAEPEPKKDEKAVGPSGGGSMAITVKGVQCTLGDADPAPCADVCAGLDRTNADSVSVVIDSTLGQHGAVEDLRTCLKDAGFTSVSVRAE